MTAKGGHFAADAFLVEVPTLGALGAEVLDPGLASVVIGDSDNVAEGDA